MDPVPSDVSLQTGGGGGGGGGIITSKTIGIYLMESIVFFSRGFIYLFSFFIQYIPKI